jgi:cholera toxin transcriptional activator
VNDANAQRRIFRFGTFELDTSTGELRKNGRAHPRIRDQALQILIMLLEKHEELVTRDELREQLWPADTFVDFDHGLNTAMNQVRGALGDSASNPTFIQTLPRRGYRFIAPVQIVVEGVSASTGGNQQALSERPQRTTTPSKTRPSILSDRGDLPVVGRTAVRILFSLIQLMYLIFYVVALARLAKIDGILITFGVHGVLLLVTLIATAAIGIPIRCYLLTAVAFNYLGLNAKFRKLFPFLLVLDELWALGPFLLVQQIGIGMALACTAVLLYLPFSQRSLY